MATKAKKAVKTVAAKIDYTPFHKRIVHQDNNQWLITVATLGRLTMVDADCVNGPSKGQAMDLINARNPVAVMIRRNLKMNLVS
jgi:hypothetical protein